jgi:Ni/Fe-hydrogenase subunit HybB-like protein
MASEALEFAPVVAEWLDLEKARRVLSKLTLGVVIFGVTLSSLHQSGLGALFLFSKPKLHPLWYTEFLPVLFFASSIFAGISMIIFEGTISHRVFKDRIDPAKHASFDEIVVSLAKGAAVSMYVYLFLKFVIFVHGQHWNYLFTKWGAWFLVEVLLFTLVPCALFTHGYRERRIGIIRTAAVMTLIGIILNRLNVSVIAFNWNNPAHYVPSLWEIWITLMVVFTEILVFRWVVNRMPVLSHAD